MGCTACGGENRAGRKFCAHCGAPLALTCPACGAANEPDERFCGECGSALDPSDAPVAAAPVVERRVVTVLFADLEGFTALAGTRDAEEVRALLTRYFDTARVVIDRYGGTIEKFIGDAVMAVWGAPTAREDDAERAVRAALELIDAVGALDEVLTLRVGVLTGEAAVTVGAVGQGMVAGDLVNTASRVQSAAEPRTVLVGESTRRASEAAIAYRDTGLHMLKGKDEPAHLWRALRVEAGRGGALRADAVEPPFVGRERELRLVKELFHAGADDGRAHLVSVLGIAGIGKSRLARELERYLDGLAGTIYWHRGRCLAYGDGVTYWALAEMLRSRAGIADGEAPRSAHEKLRTTIAELVSAEDEREWIEPRLAHLLGLEELQSPQKDDLFGAWRLFFERMAERVPVLLVFEDVQWADAALLEFLEHLLDWSRNHAILVLALARPDVADRHPSWPRAARNATTLALEPLTNDAMTALLDGVVPGLPPETRDRILARAEGVPLYAVETVRMLLDRGLLERDGDGVRATEELASLDVPETLHALVAARIDSLSPDERLVVQNAAVLGKTFSRAGLAAVTGRDEEDLEPLLAGLARKEIFTVQADPRSPDRGQHAFLQDLLRQVAYETLARPERKMRHLAAAEYLQALGEDVDLAEVVASHYVAAEDAAPDAADAPQIREQARAMLVRAGERARSLAAAGDAQRYFERALELSESALEQAELHERAGEMARYAGNLVAARSHLERARERYAEVGLPHARARIAGDLALVNFLEDRVDEAIAVTEEAYAALAEDEPDADVAIVAAQLGRFLTLGGRADEALPAVERALEIAEALRLPEVLSNALNTKAVLLERRGRIEEGRLLLRHALEIALREGLHDSAIRAYNNLLIYAAEHDEVTEMKQLLEATIALAQRVGNRFWERAYRTGVAATLWQEGDWDRAEDVIDELVAEDPERAADYEYFRLFYLAPRGEAEAARAAFAGGNVDVSNPEARTYAAAYDAYLCLYEGRPREALAAAELALNEAAEFSALHRGAKQGLASALEAAVQLGDEAKVDELLGRLEKLRPGEMSPMLQAIGARYSARRGALRGDSNVGDGFTAAAELYGQTGYPVLRGETLVEHGEWLVSTGRNDEAEPLLAEAEEFFDRLRARYWLERIARCRAGAPAFA
jgi:class 3 adenylate cyclase/tetratricopeptide (TPR) repeat protein